MPRCDSRRQVRAGTAPYTRPRLAGTLARSSLRPTSRNPPCENIVVMRGFSYIFSLSIVLLFTATVAHSFPDSETEARAGAALYKDKGCPQCHGADLSGNKKGPSLAEIRNDPAWP